MPSSDKALPTWPLLPQFDLCASDAPLSTPHVLGCLNFLAPSSQAWVCTQPAALSEAPALQVPLKGHLGFATVASLAPLAPSASPRLPEPSSPCVQLRLGSPVPVTHGQAGNIRYSETADWVFGVLHIPLPASGYCQDAVREGYDELLALVAARGKQHLVRIWNYVPRVTELDDSGDEIYRCFNLGRAQALDAVQFHTRNLPAATGIGCQGEHIAVAFLASTATGRHIENPRQVAAYHYPKEHGPRPPAFARATAWPLGQTPQWLLISGTASIIGHQTVHHGDVMAQARTALDNVQLLLAQGKASLNDVRDVVLYVRHTHDVPAVSAWFKQQLPADAHVLVTQADICRKDLLVELEAVALLRPKG